MSSGLSLCLFLALPSYILVVLLPPLPTDIWRCQMTFKVVTTRDEVVAT